MNTLRAEHSSADSRLRLCTFAATNHSIRKMIPLRDDQPTRTFAFITVVIIAINAWVFAGWQVPVGIERSVLHAAMRPVEVTHSPTPESFGHLISSMFMHGSWMHRIRNMWFLWIFGNNIEDAMGHFRFIIFYLVVGVLADF